MLAGGNFWSSLSVWMLRTKTVTIGSALSLGQADSASQRDCDGGLIIQMGEGQHQGAGYVVPKTHDDKSRLKLKTRPL